MERTSDETRQDGRRFLRVPMNGTVHYRYGAQEKGMARLHNVGRGGFAARMGRYLRPGTRLLVVVPEVMVEENPIELKTELVWCAPAEVKHEFGAGFRIICDEPDTLTAVSEWVYTALAQGGVMATTPTRLWNVNHSLTHPNRVESKQSTAAGLHMAKAGSFAASA